MSNKIVYHDGKKIEVNVVETPQKDFIAYATFLGGDGTIGVGRRPAKKVAFDTAVKNLITVTSSK